MDVPLPPAAPVATLPPAPVPPRDAAALRILVADDEQDVRDLVCLAVRRAGATAVTAVADGTAALRVARAELPDIAVLDVAMPGASGLEVCAALRADPVTAAVRVLLVSAGASLEDVARGLAAGADAYLAKPFAVAGLIHQVRALAGREAGIGGRPA